MRSLSTHTEKLSTEQWSVFYASLFCHDQEGNDLTARLAAHVGQQHWRHRSPYTRLLAGTTNEFNRALDETLGQPTDLSKAKQKRIVKINGVVPLGEATSVLRTVGNIYTSQAKVPQNANNVRRNVTRALLRLYAIASLDRGAAAIDLPSYFNGRIPGNEPSGCMDRTLFKTHAVISSLVTGVHTSMKDHALVVTEDPSGQLDMRPRVEVINPASLDPEHAWCPARDTRIDVAGQERNGLLALMATMGNVATTEIYPQYFDIVAPVSP